MNQGILTNGQLQNIVKFIYDVCKIVAGAGIITPLIKSDSIDSTIMAEVVWVVVGLFLFAVILDGIADRINS